MKKIITLFIKRLFLLMILCYFQNGISQFYTNPVGDLPDPHIAYIDGYYYYTGNLGDRVAIKRAATLEELKNVEITTIFDSGSPSGQVGSYWSSEIHKLDDKWYVYYTADSGDGQRNFVIECSDSNPITGTWTFKGKLFDSEADYYSTYPTVTEINGSRYFLWSGRANADDGTTHLYISTMTNPWTLSGSRSQIYTAGDLPDTGSAESPTVLVNAGKVFLVYMVNGCGSSDAKIGLMYMASDTDDPLETMAWTKMSSPVLDDNTEVSFNPNAPSFFKSPDNTEDWITFTALFDNGANCGNGRATRAQKFTFDGDGIPQFGAIAPVGTLLDAPSGEPALPVATVEAVPNGLYRIKSKAVTGTETLEVAGVNYWGGTNVGQWVDNSDEIHHKWYLQATEEPGDYVIISALSGLAIEVGGCNMDDNANVNMWYPNGAPCQIWTISSAGSGYFYITNKNSGKVMELEDGGNNIRQNTLNTASDFQKFDLQLLEETLDISPNPSVFNADVKLYPNPAKDYFIINGMGNGKNKNITITDMLGKNFMKTVVNTDQFKVDTSSLQSGLYIVTISTEGNRISKKIIIN